MIMYDNYNYPPGSDNEMAPWNEIEIPEREFNIGVEFQLSKKTSVESNNYYIDESPDGSYLGTEDIDWRDEYIKQHYTPLELINMYKKELEEKKKYLSDTYKIREIEHIISECECWDEEFNDVYEDK